MKKVFTADQIEKEIGMKTAGVERFHVNNDRAVSEGSASETMWNRRIIQELVDPMAEAAYLEYLLHSMAASTIVRSRLST